MFKILSKKEYARLLEMEAKVHHYVRVCSVKDDNLQAMADEIVVLRRELEKTQKIVAPVDTENSVTLKISNDMEQVTPIVRYRNDAFERLFQEGMVDDTQADNPFATQLALLTVASEALNQLLESFEAPLED